MPGRPFDHRSGCQAPCQDALRQDRRVPQGAGS
jgi:hypothetical protein